MKIFSICDHSILGCDHIMGRDESTCVGSLRLVDIVRLR